MKKESRRFVLNIMSRALIVAGAALLIPAIAAILLDEDAAARGMGGVSVACILLGCVGMALAGRIRNAVRPRIWYMTTFFTWLLLCVITIPAYWFSMPGSALSDAALSSFAGWTTTGISVYDCAKTPASLQLFRCICSWLGGIGMIMVILSLMPSRQFIGFGLASTEFPGPTFLKTEAVFRKDYKKIVAIYLALTAVHFMFLSAFGMPLFTAFMTALSNISTAGLAHINNGVITGLPGSLKAVIAVFSLLGSVSCTLFLMTARRRFSEIRRSTELKAYISKILVTAAVICCFVYLPGGGKAGTPASYVLKGFADTLIQVISYVSTSGYIAANVSEWPVFCVMLVMIEIFIGSCAVSTGGGIKEARAVIAFKTISHSIFSHIHPGSVRSLTFNKKPMKSGQIVRANLFIALFVITWLIGAMLLSIDDIGVDTALAYSQAAVTNTGSSVLEPHMTGQPAEISAFSKYVMCILMLAGRLEIYPFIMLFMRSFWKPERAA